MTNRRTDLGRELEGALGEVLAHVRGTTPLPCRIVDDPAPEHILSLRQRMKLSRQSGLTGSQQEGENRGQG
ncbi:MAG: hypothetical protein F4Z21_01440 [Acidobacteria bacterium]|nr:hypothetical protein [Acidobacteriota bacterium]